MRQLGEQWVEVIDRKRHMLKAVKGVCENCGVSHLCKLSSDCPMAWGLIAKDLGPVNEEGCLAEERTGLFPNISFTCDEWCVEYNEDYISVACFGVTKQEAIDAWNWRV